VLLGAFAVRFYWTGMPGWLYALVLVASGAAIVAGSALYLVRRPEARRQVWPEVARRAAA
jgi:hypothetical protein